MSKEQKTNPLEALERLGNYEITHDEQNNYTWTLSDTDEYATIKQALTPPTEEEVCKALSEYYGFEVMYKGLDFFPKERLSYFYCVVAMVDGCIDFADPLPPHLITMICRFYEGVKQ